MSILHSPKQPYGRFPGADRAVWPSIDELKGPGFEKFGRTDADSIPGLATALRKWDELKIYIFDEKEEKKKEGRPSPAAPAAPPGGSHVVPYVPFVARAYESDLHGHIEAGESALYEWLEGVDPRVYTLAYRMLKSDGAGLARIYDVPQSWLRKFAKTSGEKEHINGYEDGAGNVYLAGEDLPALAHELAPYFYGIEGDHMEPAVHAEIYSGGWALVKSYVEKAQRQLLEI